MFNIRYLQYFNKLLNILNIKINIIVVNLNTYYFKASF